MANGWRSDEKSMACAVIQNPIENPTETSSGVRRGPLRSPTFRVSKRLFHCAFRAVREARGSRDDAFVKRSTALARLNDVVDGLERAKAWPDSTICAAYLYGALLDGGSELDVAQIALVVDEPPEAVPWLSRPARLESIAESLRFTKLPLSWRWRPAARPVRNHEIRVALPLWTREGGRNAASFAALATDDLAGAESAQPADGDALATQLRIEREVAWQRLALTTDAFYERDWQRSHRGGGEYPGDHLWSAAAGFVDLERALQNHA